MNKSALSAEFHSPSRAIISPPDNSPRHLSLVSYNVFNGFNDPRSRCCSFMPIIEWLRGLSVEIVCFQEVTWTRITLKYFESTVRAMGFPYIAYGHAHDLYGNGFYGQVTISKTPFKSEPVVLTLEDSKNAENRAALLTQHSSGIFMSGTEPAKSESNNCDELNHR